jgi:1-pyrroline-5-carboxylate dehydrogenase
MGAVCDFSNFMGAVIDQRSSDRLSEVLERVRGEAGVETLAGGIADDSDDHFVRPTVVQADNPAHEVFTTEYFGPLLGCSCTTTPTTTA